LSSSDLIISKGGNNYFEKKDIEMSDLSIKLIDDIDINDNSMNLDEAIQD